MGCKKCAACCEVLVFTIPGLGNDRQKRIYYKAHNCKINGEQVIVPFRCPKLTEDNLCSIHETKPELCKRFKGQKLGYFKPKECKYES